MQNIGSNYLGIGIGIALIFLGISCFISNLVNSAQEKEIMLLDKKIQVLEMQIKELKK